MKDLLWSGAAEWAVSFSDIERSNVYSAQAGQILSIEGKLKSQGVEFSAAVRPTPESKIWEMSPMSLRAVTTMTSRAGHSPVMPSRTFQPLWSTVASYRNLNPGWLPVEVGVSVRHVGDR
jgi:iron complex outermembrane receptor protein